MKFDVQEEIDRFLKDWGICGPLDAKSEVDRFLKERGLVGLSEIGKAIERAVAEMRVRVGPLKTAEWVLHEGYWLIAEDIPDSRKRYALTWLACAELGVPLALRERLAQEVESDIESRTK